MKVYVGMDLRAMNVVHFDAVLACFQPARDVPCTDKEIGQKGAAKFCLVPQAGCHKQSSLNCTGQRPPSLGRATAGCMVRQRSVCWKPLYLIRTLAIV